MVQFKKIQYCIWYINQYPGYYMFTVQWQQCWLIILILDAYAHSAHTSYLWPVSWSWMRCSYQNQVHPNQIISKLWPVESTFTSEIAFKPSPMAKYWLTIQSVAEEVTHCQYCILSNDTLNYSLVYLFNMHLNRLVSLEENQWVHLHLDEYSLVKMTINLHGFTHR